MFYMYLIYEVLVMGDVENEVCFSDRKKVVILGGGLNWIGQGIEFDYCCCYVCFVLIDVGYEIIMVNCNLEMVLIDYDILDWLYFELLIFEYVLEILCIEQENGMLYGVIVQFGGQMFLKLVNVFEVEGILIFGIIFDVIDLVEDCEWFQKLLNDLNLKQLVNGIVSIDVEVIEIVEKVGFLLVICLFYVLGGCGMEIVCDMDYLKCYICEVVQVLGDSLVLLDSYLVGVIEVDVDCFLDGMIVYVVGIMEYIEEVGVYFGDSVCCLLLYMLDVVMIEELKCQFCEMVKVLNVVGLMNV